MAQLWRIDLFVRADRRAVFILKLKTRVPVYSKSDGLYVNRRDYKVAKAIAKSVAREGQRLTRVAVVARYAKSNGLSFEDAAKLFDLK